MGLKSIGLRVASFGWGLAEATLFVIVPDVLLSAVALRDRALALRLCLWALAGALAGGWLMYLWGSQDVEQVKRVLSAIPAIGEAMVAGVEQALRDMGAWATFLGPLTGTPYKIYAALAPQAEVSLALFLATSVPARLIRFVAIVLLAAWITRRWFPDWTHRQRLVLHLAFWTAFYTLYFLVFTSG